MSKIKRRDTFNSQNSRSNISTKKAMPEYFFIDIAIREIRLRIPDQFKSLDSVIEKTSGKLKSLMEIEAGLMEKYMKWKVVISRPSFSYFTHLLV